jgi:hypothetical protein
MTAVTIFKDKTVTTSGKRESALGKVFASANTYRRIQTNTNGTFKRLVNGEQIGNAVRGELDVVIVGALGQVSRVFYKDKYDPNKDPTAPDCWSNLGDKPEVASSNPQAASCAACPQNIKGSGETGGRACRYQRRLAVLLAGDDSGDVYQFNVPSKSLFGKGVGNVHPFESYRKFLAAHGEQCDTVVTNISYDLNADGMELRFTPLRNLSDAEYDIVLEAQAKPETEAYTVITVYETSTKPAEVAKPEPKPKARVQSSDEPEDEGDEVTEQPVKRTRAPAQERPAASSLADKVADLWGED